MNHKGTKAVNGEFAAQNISGEVFDFCFVASLSKLFSKTNGFRYEKSNNV